MIQINIRVVTAAKKQETVTIAAELVTILDGAPFRFVIWRGSRSYEVIEASTGQRVSEAETHKGAVMKAGSVIRTHGFPQFFARVAAVPTLNEKLAVDDPGFIPDGPYSPVQLVAKPIRRMA